MERLLLHTCCAPGGVYCVDLLRSEGIEPTAETQQPATAGSANGLRFAGVGNLRAGHYLGLFKSSV